MRESRLLAAALVVGALLGSASCHSSQPTQNTTQAIKLSFGARSLNGIWDCWDKDPGATLYCEQRFQAPNVPVLADRVTPWQYSIEISILPAGTVTETVVASSATSPPIGAPSGFPVFGSQTNFDTLTDAGRVCPSNGTPPPDCSQYHNPRSVGQGSRDVTTFNNASLTEPNILGAPDGCESQGDPACGYQVTANKGDTIIVRARKTLRADRERRRRELAGDHELRHFRRLGDGLLIHGPLERKGRGERFTADLAEHPGR